MGPDKELESARTEDIQTLSCETVIQEAETLADVSDDPLDAEVMALSGGGPAGPDNPIQHAGGVVYNGLQFTKVGLAIRGDTAFTIEVPPDWRDRLWIGWGTNGYSLASTLKVPECTPTTPDAEWLVYPGGFWTKNRACAPLNIKNNGGTRTIHVPIRQSCP